MVLADSCRTKLVTPEHLLLTALGDRVVVAVLESSVMDLPIEEVKDQLRGYIGKLEHYDQDDSNRELLASHQYGELMHILGQECEARSINVVGMPLFFNAMWQLKDSFAANCLKALVNQDTIRFFKRLDDAYQSAGLDDDNAGRVSIEEDPLEADVQQGTPQGQPAGSWRDYVLCINDHLADHNPLIGREEELDRTVQVLCRKDKNNPLHIGEPGVGKTSIVYGLAQRIAGGNVPESLRDAQIYQLDLGALIAGTQYRGDFEKRLKTVMKGIAAQQGAILYIDEIHNIVGAGQTGEGSMDAGNLLKPYLEGGRVRFIGATTYEEYNRHIMRNRGLMRRFQQVPIEEPSVDQALQIVKMLKEGYEKFHGVKYDDDALELAVTGSARHITDRCLPDKAIDLIDEAAAKLRLEIDSVPEELDEIERRIRQLEIEREAIKRENDLDKIAQIDKELGGMREQRDQMKARWQNEKQIVEAIQAEVKNIESYKFEAEQAEMSFHTPSQ